MPGEEPFNIDQILSTGGDEEGATPPEGAAAGTQKPGGEPPSKEKEEYKDLQEKIRQQSEDMKEMKEANKKMQTFIDRVTGNDEATQKKVAEAMERQEWDENTPKKVQETVESVKEDFTKKLDVVRQEAKLQQVYREIREEFDVDLEKVAPKLLPVLDSFTPEVKRKDPKMVLTQALKIIGEDKLREVPSPSYNEEGGSPSSVKATKAQVDKEADAIKKRLFKNAEKKKANVFGVG
jgi:hypothetical protein